MHYTLKCDPLTTRDNFNCGEWDYLSYVIVHDSTGIMDSTEAEHSNFTIAGTTPDVFNYVQLPVADTFYRYRMIRVVDNVTSVQSVTLGNGNNNSPEAFNNTRAQYLFTAAELNTAGLTAGDITSIGFAVATAGMSSNTRIRMKTTGRTQLTRLETSGFMTVYEGDLNAVPGMNQIQLLEDFVWDGTSNIIVEFANNAPSVIDLQADAQADAGVTVGHGDKYYEIGSNGYLELEDASTALSALDSFVTVSLWARGSEVLPTNTSIFEGKDKAGNRAIQAHLPWGNKRVHWDAGQESGYDRINKDATDAQIKENWNHWVFTKNVATGTMRIYLNGVLWQSGTKKFRKFPEIVNFRIGKGINNYQYFGAIDRFSVWKSELTAAQVSDLNQNDINQAQSNFGDLLFSFSFDNHTSGTRTIESDFNPNIKATFYGDMKVAPYSKDAFFRSSVTHERPMMEFSMADQTTHMDSVLEKDVVSRPLVYIDLFEDSNDPTKKTGEASGYEAGYVFSYNPDGSKKDSSMVANPTTLTRTMSPYMAYSERVNNIEIGRYITPYGIGLDLGPDGFRWVYDVTDYAELLEGRVTFSAGNQQELIDVKFEMIEGTPVRDLKEISYYINRSSRRYSDIADDIAFTNKKIAIHPEAKTHKLVTRITGHGHNTDGGNEPHCCEWADKQHYMKIDGKEALQWDIWMDDKCALNPIFDQGGNWAPPRAGWCPAAPVDDFNFDITSYVTGDSVALDYEIEPVPVDNQGQGGGNYVVAMHLMQYGDYNFTHDATVEQIISPNNWEYYSRLNPTCSKPKIRIRNTGKTTITELGLKYGVIGGNPITYYWKGELTSDEAKDIDLPFAIWGYNTTADNNRFFAEVTTINGQDDQYADNNRAESDFEAPNITPKNLKLMFRQNAIADATLQIFDDQGKVVYEKLDAAASELVREDISLPRGCYKMVCETENQFGLYYPLIPQIGSGLLRLYASGSSFNVNFNPDFGKSVEYYFTVGHGLHTDDIALSDWSLYPNPSQGLITLQTGTKSEGNAYTINVRNMAGQVVHSQNGLVNGGLIQVDIQDQTSGIYVVELVENNKKQSFKVAIH
jgi:hypothetical protein